MNDEMEYEVAISFASEDSDIAKQLQLALNNLDCKSYFYLKNEADTWGSNLRDKLEEIYSEKAKYAIVLFSEAYIASLNDTDIERDNRWTKTELDAIKKRKSDNPDFVYLLPIRLTPEISLDFDEELKGLVYLDWKSNPEEIAKYTHELLGKELSELDETAKAGNIVYSDGDNKFVITNSNIGNFNQVINSDSAQGPEVTEKDLEGITQTFNFYKPEDNRVICVNCSTLLNAKNVGKIKCPNCNRINYLENPNRKARKYLTLKPEEDKEFSKILAHIQNKTIDKKYDEAYEYCLQAEEMAPGEPQTWIAFTKTVSLLEIEKKTASLDIIRKIKPHTDKCSACKLPKDDYRLLLNDVAQELFKIDSARIRTMLGQKAEELKKWSKKDFRRFLMLLKTFELCYNLSDKDPLFLVEYLKILTHKSTWLVKSIVTEELINQPTPISFDAKKKYSSLISKIPKNNKDYENLNVQSETFYIKKVEFFKIQSISNDQ